MSKIGALGGIGLLAIGIFALFAGDQIASTEEGIANSVGNLLSNTWVAIGLITAGSIWLASDLGLLKRISKA